ncbi:hypothetical protein [Mycolicibacterium celeriflavum]|uniref:Uncharacterized protein n=1 Tax=Mycolicibacterium celeriflavum TaxID=1249101 RepID=A0A1X0BY85_MYCCF|nr:hypothetical protein [Mycolicibacterium celeriflavum]MCV7236847.1 hypothetical protein [Mycolicibacterium celeriflavum]ORA49511.1 hypothetical protein BST21_06470 [Mycolicibacterium celeriflavum]BBY43907.1 hypothetical protein MCEL_22020 [Mycolicibacterium celeriflavum]
MPADTVLANAAFGDDPGLWPLPSAATPRGLWLRAVAAGGQGRYASARADLTKLYRSAGPERALAYSTEASFLRQLGWHTRARRWDGRALALAGSDTEAVADACIGLAADALGVRRFEASARALDGAGAILTPSAPPRLPVRLAWVSAELAMARGDGAAAVAHAERAVEYAAALGSARHRVKSSVVLAAARCSAGDLEAARTMADSALDDAQCLGMVPLQWALACLLTDIGSAGHSSQDMVVLRDGCADTVRRRGGEWSVR